LARFKLFPRHRRLSLRELLGISQASHQVSRKHHLRIVRDPMSPLKNAEQRAAYDSVRIRLVRLLHRPFG
jgi:hypothetical protein